MPRVGVRAPWIFLVVTGAAILIGMAWCGVRWIQSARRRGPLEQGQAAYQHQDWPTAERKAREQLRRDREDPEALHLLGRALYRQGRDQAAAAIFERLGPGAMAAEDYLLAGQACVRSGKADLAIKVWQKAVQLDPNHFPSRIALEQAFFRMDKLSDAEREAESLLAQPGRNALAEFLRGQIRIQQSDPAGVVRSFERALERPDQWASLVAPDFVRKQLARCLLQTGQPALARERLHQLTSQDRDQETCWLLSRCDLQEAVPTEAAVSTRARSYRQSHPLEPEPATFVGEARCAACHPANFRDQNASRHARTFFRKEKLPAVSFPPRPIADPSNDRVVHAFHKRGESLEVETRGEEQLYQTIVDYAFGSGDRGLTLVGHNPEGQSIEYRLSLYPEGMVWDVTTGQTLHPGRDALYQGHAISIDDIRHCMGCHNTNPHAILAATGPESSDRAIGCERCHGPGGNHLRAAAAQDFASRDADLAIARPSLVSGPAIVGLCAECHSQKKLGIVLTPGSPNSIRFQGTTLTWSRCYKESDHNLDCVTCHNPHRNAETSTRWYESRCLQCHSYAGATANRAGGLAGAGPRQSCPIQPASGCIACHMPKLATSTAHTRFTDHFIRVHPAPDSYGRPRMPRREIGPTSP
jgi:tetratricopeptide (TPR) repeat protein